jgi:hypothetical protein
MQQLEQYSSKQNFTHKKEKKFTWGYLIHECAFPLHQTPTHAWYNIIMSTNNSSSISYLHS